MPYCADPAEPAVEIIPRRRRCPRQTLRTLAYVNLNEGNGGIIRDIAETGLAVQAVGALRAGQEVSLRFDLLSPRVRVDARGIVAWADPGGQAGIELLETSPRIRRALRDWLLTQMLSSAVISGRDSIFTVSREDDLTFSPTATVPIVLQPVATAEVLAVPALDQTWFKLSDRTFAMLIDGLVLLCAVLLFSISTIVVMGGVPAWPLAAALLFTTATIFVAVYQILFSDSFCGATPGARLARLASTSEEQQQPQRFR
jgi:hypothetical protein